MALYQPSSDFTLQAAEPGFTLNQSASELAA